MKPTVLDEPVGEGERRHEATAEPTRPSRSLIARHLRQQQEAGLGEVFLSLRSSDLLDSARHRERQRVRLRPWHRERLRARRDSTISKHRVTATSTLSGSASSVLASSSSDPSSTAVNDLPSDHDQLRELALRCKCYSSMMKALL